MGWTVGSDSGSETLTEDDDIYETHINELRVAVDASMREVFNVKASVYGAVGDGDTDDTTAIQNTLDAGAGGVVYFPKGDYKISTTLTVSANTTIFGYNARIFNTVTHQYLITGDSGIKIYGLELEGVTYDPYSFNGRGISIRGTNGSEKKEIVIRDCYIHDIGFYGIYLEYCHNVSISHTRLISIGYAGVQHIACENSHVDKCHIKDINSEYVNQYGVSFTSWNEAIHPRTSDSSVTNCLIEDMSKWAAIDSHGGLRIKILNNIIRNCKQGIVLKCRPSSGVAVDCASECTVSGNKVYGAVIAVNGHSNILRYAKNNIISNNYIFEGGLEGGNKNATGSIESYNTENLIIANNVIQNGYASGILLRWNSTGISVTGNTITDIQNNVVNQTCGIYCLQNVKGIISGNNIYRRDTSINTYVGEIGIYVTEDDNDITLGTNKITFTNPLIIHEANVDYGIFTSNDARFFGCDTSPEGVITAPIGSICIRRTGGSGTTLYIKESGSDSSGWIGK